MLEELQVALNALVAQRAQVVAAGWSLQHCWLVQVKPGGTARTGSKYWQVRSRQPMFDGKTLKHLKSHEVDDYRAAIERGQQLKRLDRQIEKLQQKIAQLASTTDMDHSPAEPSTGQEAFVPASALTQDAWERSSQEPAPLVQFTNMTEQERIVKEILTHSQGLRTALRRSLDLSRQLGKRYIDSGNENSG